MYQLMISFYNCWEDNPEHIRYVAHLVDDKIKELGYKAAGLDTSRKAILTAVNIMHEKYY